MCSHRFTSCDVSVPGEEREMIAALSRNAGGMEDVKTAMLACSDGVYLLFLHRVFLLLFFLYCQSLSDFIKLLKTEIKKMAGSLL